ncbi:protein-tyrosine phosphatase family protein [Actinomycetospora sp. C-140]
MTEDLRDDDFIPAHLRDDLDDEPPPWPPHEIVPGVWQSGDPEPGEHWDAVFDLHGSDLPLEDVEFYVHWLIEDGPAPDFTTLRGLADLVDDMRRDGKRVLIHCAAGINRSGLLSAAALIRGGHDPDEAIALVRAARTGALNNPNFVDLLHDPRWSPRE